MPEIWRRPRPFGLHRLRGLDRQHELFVLPVA